MKEQILANLENPHQLEKLYRESKSVFKKEFDLLYNTISDNKTAQVWQERLNYESDGISWGATGEMIVVALLAFFAAFLTKLPAVMAWQKEFFFSRNISFLFFPMLMVYFTWKEKTSVKRLLIVAGVVFTSAIYINFLPGTDNDTVLLACIHLPLFTWALLGIVFTNETGNLRKRVDFLHYNGDLAVMTALMLIAGGIVTVMTIGLFKMIGLAIGEYYFNNIVFPGLAATPIIGTWLVRNNPQLVSKVSPVIARVFTPVVLATLIVYLSAVFYTGKNPYNDRDFLLIFNLLLIGVMALILFAVTGASKTAGNKISLILLLALSLVTILVNGITLSAILFRITEGGITPNRLAVLGANILILTNLLLVTYRLIKSMKDSGPVESIEAGIASFLPVYFLWMALVIFVFPLVFGFK
jgi:hypothetical protein